MPVVRFNLVGNDGVFNFKPVGSEISLRVTSEDEAWSVAGALSSVAEVFCPIHSVPSPRGVNLFTEGRKGDTSSAPILIAEIRVE